MSFFIVARGLISNSKVVGCDWQSQKLLDFCQELQSFFLACGLKEALTWNLQEIELKLVMNGHYLNTIMAPFVNFDILNLVDCPVLLFVFAKDRGVVLE